MAAKASKSLKDLYRAQIWAVIAANVATLFIVSHYEQLSNEGAARVLPEVSRLLPIGLGLVIATVANGILSSDLKARLVFLRWNHALPGHRAFSEYGPADPRINMSKIAKVLRGNLPSGPVQENQAWYKMLKEVEAEPSVRHAHREFLFTRDYTALAVLFIILFGPVAALTARAGTPLAIYTVFLLLQLALVRHAAATYGKRFVTTVMACRATKPK